MNIYKIKAMDFFPMLLEIIYYFFKSLHFIDCNRMSTDYQTNEEFSSNIPSSAT